MVQTVVLVDKLYNFSTEKQQKDLTLRYLKYLKERVQGIPGTRINIKKLRKYDNRFELVITGPEEKFVINILKKEIGFITEFDDVKIGQIYKGFMTDVGKVGFGIFIDCGILNPPTDVLISLNDLRNQLCGEIKMSLPKIIAAYDFIDRFPLFIEITSIDGENNKIQGKIHEKSLGIYSKIVKENIDAIFISGETKGQLKKALVRSGHLRDFISIKRYGFLENLVLLKEGTSAPGIIADIGKYLRKSKISAIRPSRILNLFPAI